MWRLVLLASGFTLAAAVVTSSPDYDLSVLKIVRTVSEDKTQMTYSVEFTATQEPGVKWSYANWDIGREMEITNDSSMQFANGRGTTTLTYSAERLMYLTIGDLDNHYLVLHLKWYSSTGKLSYSQDLNSGASSVSPGYGITYSADEGEAFDVTLTGPKHIAQGQMWSRFPNLGMDNIKLTATYVDPESGELVSTMDPFDYPDMDQFLTQDLSYSDDAATLRLAFRTQGQNINGFFRVLSDFHHETKDNPEMLERVQEVVVISVHDSATPGPFPVGFSQVRTSHRLSAYRCRHGDDTCAVMCFGYANDIVDATIIQTKDDIQTEMTIETSFITRNRVKFTARIDTSGDFSAAFLCRITSRDGTIGEATATVRER